MQLKYFASGPVAQPSSTCHLRDWGCFPCLKKGSAGGEAHGRCWDKRGTGEMLRGFGVWCHGWGRALELQGLWCLVNIVETACQE